MIIMPVPKDIRNVKAKFIGPFTKRQTYAIVPAVFFLHFLIRILLIITIEIFVGDLALLCQLVEGVFRDVWTTFWSKKFHDRHVS